MGRIRNVYDRRIEDFNYSNADYSAQQVDADNNQLRVLGEVEVELQEEVRQIPAVQVKVTNEVESAMMRATTAEEDEEVKAVLEAIRLQPNGNYQNKDRPDIQIERTSNQDISSSSGGLMSPDALPISERHNSGNNTNNAAGDEQLLRLQDYNLLYNAERQTYFQLHSSNERGTNRPPPSSGNRLLQQVVGNTLSAAFGLNANDDDVKNTTMEMTTTQTVRLYDAASLRQSRFNPFQPTR